MPIARRSLLGTLVFGVLLCLGDPRAAAAGMPGQAPLTLNALMAELAHKPHRTARFTERRYFAALRAPLDLSGTLSFSPPDRLEKTTVAPNRERLVAEGDRLTVEAQKGRYQVVDLADHPEIAAFIESIRGTLAGDGVTLQRFYAVSVEGTAEDWRLGLTPRLEPMRKVVHQIRIDGSRGRIETIYLEETNGDRSVMSIAADEP